MKRFLISGIASGALALTLLAGSYAATAQAAAPNAPAAQATAAPGAPDPAKPGEDHAGRGVVGVLVRSLAELTNLKPGAIIKDLRAGKSLATIASEHGSSGAALVKAARAKLETRLKQAVTAGKISQAQADAMLKRFDTEAPNLVNSTDLGKGGKGEKGGHAGRHGLVAATASVTGLTEEQVQTELKSGKTFAQIAQAHGKTVDDILAKLRELGEKKLDSAIERARQRLNSPKAAGA